MKKVLLGFAWGHRNGEPGLSNEDMADYAVEHWDEYVHHSFQTEIAKAVRRQGQEPDHQIVGLALQQKLSRDSSMIVRGHLDGLIVKGHGLTDIEYNVLCKEQHWSGCKWFLQKELLARGVPNAKLVRVPVAIRFDPQSTQWYTRNPASVLGYKIARGVESLLKGEIRLSDVVKHFLGGKK